jgi:hypothetical protein
MIHKGQIRRVPKNNPMVQNRFVNGLFKIAACAPRKRSFVSG